MRRRFVVWKVRAALQCRFRQVHLVEHGANGVDVKRLAVMRTGDDRDLTLIEAESLGDPGAHDRRGDERLGGRAQENRDVHRSDGVENVALVVGNARSDAMDRFDAATTRYGDCRRTVEKNRHCDSVQCPTFQNAPENDVVCPCNRSVNAPICRR